MHVHWQCQVCCVRLVAIAMCFIQLCRLAEYVLDGRGQVLLRIIPSEVQQAVTDDRKITQHTTCSPRLKVRALCAELQLQKYYSVHYSCGRCRQ